MTAILLRLKETLDFVAMSCVHDSIEKAIKETANLFRRRPEYFLTEADMRCHFFSSLYQEPTLNREAETIDHGYSIPLHAEVRWYGQTGQLKYRSDLVVLRTADLRTRRGKFEFPTKGFAFNKFDAIIELKLRRINGESNDRLSANIRRDIDKLLKIKSETQPYSDHSKFYVLVFDKKGRFLKTPPQPVDGVKLIYVSIGPL